MNTKSLLTRIGVPVLSLAMLGGLGATLATSASPASAATMSSVVKVKTVTGTTYSPNHYDTTSAPTGITVTNGPLWAYDNLHETWTAVPQGNGNWVVTAKVTGTFDGFASPTTGAPEHNQGVVTGTIQYQVNSPNTPKASLLPRQEPSYTGLGTALSQFFGGSETTSGATPYHFAYSLVDGTVYTQSG